MPDVVEPGTRLVERYRLDERLGGPDHADHPDHAAAPGHSAAPGETMTYWRAHDELLERPVGICLLRAGDVHAGQVLRAARKAAVLTDSRFLRVLDASEVDGVVYVVSEWVSATHLVDLLSDGPLPPEEARALTVEVAGALAAAHEAGLAHLCLAPEHVLRTAHGQVKLAGLGVDAAARGIAAAAPAEAAARDTQAAAGLLYACLTARWPGNSASTLPAAPHDGVDLVRPRQVRAGVPDDLDNVVCRALGVPGRHGGGPLRTPGELVAALGETSSGRTVTARLPAAAPAARDDRPAVTSPAYVSVYDDQGPPRRRFRPVTALWLLVAVMLLAGLVLAVAQLLGNGGGGTDAAQAPDGTKESPSAAADGQPVKVTGTTTFDPLPDGTGEENSDRAALAVDGDADTAWPTKTYDDPFGPAGIKDGVGLVLDLGEARDVAGVTVTVEGGATDLEVRVAQNEGSALRDYAPFGAAATADPRVEVRSDKPVRGRYVLVWLTSLPAADGGYRGEVSEVTVSSPPR